MEENHDEMEDVAGASSDSFADDSEDDGPSTSGQDDGSFIEAGHCTCFYLLHLFVFSLIYIQQSIFVYVYCSYLF